MEKCCRNKNQREKLIKNQIKTTILFFILLSNNYPFETKKQSSVEAIKFYDQNVMGLKRITTF